MHISDLSGTGVKYRTKRVVASKGLFPGDGGGGGGGVLGRRSIKRTSRRGARKVNKGAQGCPHLHDR